MSAHADDDGACDESAGNGTAAMFAMFCRAAAAVCVSLRLSRSRSLFVPQLVCLFFSVNEAFVLVHASKLIKEFNTVNLLRLVETLQIKALK